jgi:hypothetical protein
MEKFFSQVGGAFCGTMRCPNLSLDTDYHWRRSYQSSGGCSAQPSEVQNGNHTGRVLTTAHHPPDNCAWTLPGSSPSFPHA